MFAAGSGAWSCEKLGKGEATAINDLITLNLDIRQFAQDAIANCRSPELLAAFFETIRSVTVLDPTCGSGAFLFAALNILEPLYEACLDRMEGFLAAAESKTAAKTNGNGGGLPSPAGRGAGGEGRRPTAKAKCFDQFRTVLQSVNNNHPNAKYFILKSIIINNLFGVDIMEEAVEICKLRLFLKLVAQVETRAGSASSRCPTSTSTSAPATRSSATPPSTKSAAATRPVIRDFR